MSSSIQTIKDLAYSSANVYVEFLLGLVVSILIARSLGPDEYGIYTLIVWLASLGITMTNAGVSVGAIKFFSEMTGKGRNEIIRPLHVYFRKIQAIKVAVLVAAIAVAALFFPNLILEPKYSSLIWFLVPVILFKSFHMYQVGVIKGLQEFRHLAVIALVVAPLNVGLVLIATYWFPTVAGFLTAFLLTSFSFWAVSTISGKQAIEAHSPETTRDVLVDDELKRRVHLHLKTVSFIAIFGFIIYGQSEVVFLKHFATTSDIAFFSVGFMLMRAGTALVPGVYNNVLFSRISHSLADPESSEAQSVVSGARHMFILSAMVGIPLAIYADDVVTLFYGTEYGPAALVLRIFSLMSIVSATKNSTNAYLMSADKQVTILMIMITAITATLALDYVLIVNYGLIGAIAAYAIVDLLSTFAISGYAFKLLNAWPSLWKSTKMAFAMVLAGVITVLFDTLISFQFSFLAGGVVFVLCFSLLLLLLDCLESPDYDAIRELIGNRSGIMSRILLRLVRA